MEDHSGDEDERGVVNVHVRPPDPSATSVTVLRPREYLRHFSSPTAPSSTV